MVNLKFFFSFFLLIFSFQLLFAVDPCKYNKTISGSIFSDSVNWYIFYGDNTALRWAKYHTLANCDKLDYAAFPLTNWLTKTSCDLTFDGSLVKANFDILGTGLKEDVYNFLNSNSLYSTILNHNLYMKSNLSYDLYNSSGYVASRGVQTINISPDGNLVNLVNSPFTEAGVLSNYGPGIYKVKLVVTPIDNKCDFGTGIIANPASHDIVTWTIDDSDADGLENSQDFCTYTPWNDTNGHTANNMYEFNGCPFKYTKVNPDCSFFNQSSSEFNACNGPVLKEDRFPVHNASGTAKYVCNENPDSIEILPVKLRDFSEIFINKKTCKLRYNGNNCFVFGQERPSSINLYKTRFYYGTMPPSKCASCNNGEVKIGGVTIDLTGYYAEPPIKISLPILPDPTTGEFEFTDDNDDNKVKCKSDGTCKWKKTDEEFNITELPPIRGYDYTLIDNGVKTQELISPEVVALVAHKIKRFRNTNEIEDLMYKSLDLVRGMDIVKNVTYDGTNSKIKIKLNAIAGQRNITLYQVLPKYMANNLSQINIINNSGGEFFVKDKDPVIGWYFNETTGDEEVEYEIPGNSTGGVIILTQDPILFNEGELVVNYRESVCNADEAFLFEIDSLDSSNLYLPNSAKTYKVCVAHLTENLYNDSTHANVLDLFDFENGANLSLNKVLTNQVSISTDNTSIYWGMLVQEENPDGTFSCLGSIDDENSSKFGDCAYNPQKRIWLHLGADLYSPTTEISYPYLAHNMKVVLTAKDNAGGSGIANITYQIDSNTPITKTFTDNSTEEKLDFQETCSNDWGCTKNIKYFSCDLQGNCEDEKTFELNIIDKGTSCTAECLAKPSPNRFVKECRNINGCTFYPINNESINDDGKYVAEKCDLATKGTWVKYDNYHDILCPNGPIKKSIFSSEPINIHMSKCDQVIKTPYPVIINGEQLIMNVVSCFNYN